MIKSHIKSSLKKGLLLFLAILFYIQTYPGNDYPLLVWIALVPWLLALNKNSWKENTLLNFLFSAIIYLVYLWTPFYDAVFLMSNEISLASILTFLHLFSYIIPFIVLGSLYHRFNTHRIIDIIYLASIFTFVSMTVPTLFTYNMATSLYNFPILLQVLDISGISLLLWFIVVVNLSLKNVILLLWKKNIKKDLLKNSILLIATLCLVIFYGYWHLNSKATKEPKSNISIATIQPNMGQYLHQMAMIRDNKESTPYSHIELSRKALAQSKKIDLIVWPEGGLSVDCDNKTILKKLSNFIEEVNTPLIYQCNQSIETNASKINYNQSRYLGSTGQLEATYNKQNLIPLFEYVPEALQETFVSQEFHNELLFEKGKNIRLFDNGHAKIMPALCYDAHSNKIIEEGLKLNGNLLIIQSNDRIFKKSKIGLFDTAINIISAISFRVPMVKSSNSGYGVFLSASGEIISDSLTPPNQRHISVNTLKLQDTFSFYRAYGDWFYWITLILTLYFGIKKFIFKL